MIQQECIDELAEVAGVGERVKEITARAMNGELDFEGALTERVGLLAGLDAAVIDRVLAERITLMPGGRELLATMKANGGHAALVSGGFTAFTASVAAQLGFDENRANTLLIEDGQLTGHAYDALPTVAGQGTCLREWEEQGLRADTVLIAVGGGGLIAGALGWLDGARKVVAVEPETSCALHAALAADQPVDVEVSGVAANALGARRIGQICLDLAQQHQIPSVLVSDDAILAAQRALWQAHRQLVEPAGATALAALMSGAYRPAQGETVAVLVCGGNIAPDPFLQAIPR